MADRAYDTNAICQQIETQDAAPNIPPKRTRTWKSCFSPVLYRGRNAIERMFCRLKDYRRIATRYDEHAANYASAVYLVSGCETSFAFSTMTWVRGISAGRACPVGLALRRLRLAARRSATT